MADLQTQLKVYLKTKSAITDLVGTGDEAQIFLKRAPEDATLPYIVIHTFEGVSETHLSGLSGLARMRIQIDAYGVDSSAAFTLAEAIRLAPLAMYRGMIGSVYAREDGNGGFEHEVDPPLTGDTKLRYRVSRDYMFTYNEPTS